ncbi:hypothetical protein GF322_05265 [Candidatus Dependentiae bacterium]|nr:hypothetical protein [Candidatus Dependentiae bacterium]
MIYYKTSFVYKIIIFSTIIFFNYSNTEITYNDFIESFVSHYEFNAEGRYAHEYHPALLDRTAHSLDDFETDLIKKGLNLKGRIVICGYEEHGIPSYYPDFKRSEIDDEASSKNNAGWSLRLHNRFGFMTGFLFRDFDYYTKKWFESKKNIFEHIDSEEIDFFNDKAVIFHEHAFGEALPLIYKSEVNIVKQFRTQNFKGIFQELIKFWNCLYKGGLKVGNQQFAGTQDILFSIEYAKHLIRSNLPFLRFYVGPDITYPIEVSAIQNKDATIHAQNFVKIFSKNILRKNEKPTAYIFCSFVDGVGKSTMLGNIKNYLKYDSNIQNYERVDNSSSQLAEVFKLKENIFIADLPAQVSHFTYKPDGLVYVCVGREISQQLIEQVQKFTRENKNLLRKNYQELLDEVKKIIEEEGYFSKKLNDPEFPEKTFLKNLILTKKEKINRWIPFNYKNKKYVFNFYEPYQIRILTPLNFAQSEGLKNIETEQMLFFDGVRLPFPYGFFMKDLIEKLQNRGVQDIVFVDFISMYPRSSRENIRINYLLQQMALLNSDFDPIFSLYRDFVNEAELFSLLKDSDSSEKILGFYRLETLVRLALFKIIVEREYGDLEGFSLEDLTKLIRLQIKKVLENDTALLNKLTYKKLKAETFNLEKIYGLTKNFINIQQFSFTKAILFSEYLSNLFARNISNDSLNEIWQDPGEILNDDFSLDDGEIDKVMTTNKGIDVRVLYRFDIECKDENLLAPFLRSLRCLWYAAISNLINTKQIGVDEFILEKEKYFVPPIFLKRGKENKVYLVQRLFNPWNEKMPDNIKKMDEKFNLLGLKESKWGEFNDKPFCLDWKSLNTYTKIFAFDFDNSAEQTYLWNKTESTFIVQNYQRDVDQPLVISTAEFYERLIKSFIWNREYEGMLKQAQKNGYYKDRKKINESEKEQAKVTKYTDNKFDYFVNQNQQKHKKIFLGSEENIEIAKFVVRCFATLEMIIKDPDADIGLRIENKEDFKAAIKLFEKITLPKYFGILFEVDLFDNYDYVEPVVEL